MLNQIPYTQLANQVNLRLKMLTGLLQNIRLRRCQVGQMDIVNDNLLDLVRDFPCLTETVDFFLSEGFALPSVGILDKNLDS